MAHEEVIGKYGENHILVESMENHATREKILEWGSILRTCFTNRNQQQLPLNASTETLQLHQHQYVQEIQSDIRCLKTNRETDQKTLRQLVPFVETIADNIDILSEKFNDMSDMMKEMKEHFKNNSSRTRTHAYSDTASEYDNIPTKRVRLTQTTLQGSNCIYRKYVYVL